MTYIIEAKDGIVNVDSGDKLLTLSDSLLPKLASGSSYVIVLYNVTTGETTSFEEGAYSSFPQLKLNTSTLDPGLWKLGIVGIATPDRKTAQAYWDDTRFPNLTPPEGISITKRLTAADILTLGIDPKDFTFNVVNTTTYFKPPTFSVTSTELSDKVLNVDAGEKILKLDIIADDDRSKFDSISITFKNDISQTEKSLYYGADNTGRLRNQFSILSDFSWASPGSWYPKSIYARDTSGNELEYNKDGFDDQQEISRLAAAGIDVSAITFNVINKTPDIQKPAVTLSLPELSDGVLNIDQGEKSLTLNADFIDIGSGFGSLDISWENVKSGARFNFWADASSIATPGKINIQQDVSWLASGDWKVDYLRIEDKAENNLLYSDYDFNSTSQKQNLLLAGIDIDKLAFRVVNSNGDTTAPVISLSAAEINDGVLDAAAGEKQLTIAGTLSDNKSGIEGLSLRFINIESNSFRDLWISPYEINQNGSFNKNLDFSWAANGKWQIQNLSFNDKAGNSLNFYASNDWSFANDQKSKLLLAGIDIDKFTFTVKNSIEDITPSKVTLSSPQLSDKKIDVDSGEKLIQFNGTINETGSGFERLNITFENQNDRTSRSIYLDQQWSNIQSNGSFSTTVDFSWASAGIWKVSNVWGGDKAGNQLHYYTSYFDQSSSWALTDAYNAKRYLLKNGLDLDALTFSVVNSNSDATPPTIQVSSAEIADKTLDLRTGEKQITLEGAVADNKSGFSYLGISYINNATQEQKWFSISSYELDASRKFKKSFDFNGSSAGAWSIQSVNLSDVAQNSINYYNGSYDSVVQKQKLKDAGFDVDAFGFTLIDLDSTLPTYSLTPSVTSINEGGTLTTSVATTNVASGTTLYYALSGTGISAADFSAGALTGQLSVGTNGSASFSHTLASDLTTEGPETLQIKLFSDSARTNQVGDTASVTISDTSTTPAPTYSLTPSSASINEGSTLTTTVATTNVASGTTLYYALSGTGISAADFSAGALTGQLSVGTNGSASFSHTLASDLTTEGPETLQIKLFSDSARTTQVGSTASITITDTSTTSILEKLPRPSHEWLVDKWWDNKSVTAATVLKDNSAFISGYTQKAFDGQVYSGNTDGFLASYSADGEKKWSRIIGSSSYDSAFEIQPAPDGSIYIAGLTSGEINSQRNNGKNDVFLIKYSDSGVPIWTKVFGSTSDDYIDKLLVVQDGSIFAAGGALGSFNLQAYKGNSDGYIIKINPEGLVQWTKFLGTSQYDEIRDLAEGPNGSIYVCGETYGNYEALQNKGSSDVFLSKLNSSGTVEWSRSLGSSSSDYANRIVVDKSGNVYIAGETSGSLGSQTNKGNSDAFIAKYNSDGTNQWLQTFGTADYDYAESLAIASDGTIFVAGYTNGGFKGETGYDGILAKFTPDGILDWMGLVGASSFGTSQVIQAEGGDIYVGSNTNDGRFNAQKYSLDAIQFPSPTYSLNPSATTINEGSTLTTSIATSNVASGTTLYYALSGTGISAADFSSGALTGQLSVGTNGTATFSHTLASDLTTEGPETIQIKLFSDSARTIQVGSTASITISDTSTTQAPTYSLTPSSASINEGGTLTTSIATTNVASGTTLYYTLSGTGINAADFSAGALTGQLSVGTNGTASFSHTLASDLTTEGPETLQIKLFSDSARTIQVGDTAAVSIQDLSTASSSLKWIQYPASDTWNSVTSIKEYTGGVVYATGYKKSSTNSLDTNGFVAKYNENGDLYWVKEIGTDQYDEILDLAIGKNGNLIVTGTSRGNIGEFANQGDSDGFVSMLSPEGNGIWTSKLASNATDEPYSIATDNAGNIYVGGYTRGSIEGIQFAGEEDSFIAKFDPNGNRMWIKTIATEFSEEITSLNYSKDDYIYATGAKQTAIDGTSNIFIAKLSSGGAIEWNTVIDSPVDQYPFSSQINANNKITIAGSSKWKDPLLFLVNIDGSRQPIGTTGLPTIGGIKALTTTGDDRIIVAAGNSLYEHLNGQWQKTVDLPSTLSARDILYSHDGNLYVSGSEYGASSPISPVGTQRGFLAKLQINIPTYSLTPSATSINEGGTLTTTVATSNVASGTTLYYALSGTGISAADFSSGALTGQVTTGTNGTATFSHTLANDLTTEGTETLQIKLFSDSARTIQVGETASLTISDTSTTPAPTYSLTPSSASINEGSTLTTTVATTNVASGTTLYYALSGTGISAADFSSGALTGQLSVGTNGTASFSHTLASDLTTEGTETLQIKLFSDSARTIQVGDTATVTISDTSTTPAPTYSLTPSVTSINEGSTLTTSIATTNVASGTTLYYALSGTGISAADFSSGALTGQVTTGTNGSATFSHTLANDRTAEGTETLQIKLFSDSSRNTQVGSTASVTINDTSSPPVQTVYTASSQLSYTPGNNVSLPLLYTTNTADQNLTGLTLNVHYNSSLLTPSGANNGVSGLLSASIATSTLIPDTNNTDNDPLTDKIVQLLWASFDTKFPGTALPATLGTLSFSTSTAKTDTLTGQPLSTSIRYTAASTTVGYDFLTGSTTLKAQSFNLDVDGDGLVTPLGDGLMVIRKLFGSAFAGDALCNKAISPTATRSCAQIHDYIQQAIDSGLLDIDKDGKTTPLGDGLMVIRYLFGSAFAGNALTNKAISPDSPYFSNSNAPSIVAANIDALKPTTTTPVI